MMGDRSCYVLGSSPHRLGTIFVNVYLAGGKIWYGWAHETREDAKRASRSLSKRDNNGRIYLLRITRKVQP